MDLWLGQRLVSVYSVRMPSDGGLAAYLEACGLLEQHLRASPHWLLGIDVNCDLRMADFGPLGHDEYPGVPTADGLERGELLAQVVVALRGGIPQILHGVLDATHAT